MERSLSASLVHAAVLPQGLRTEQQRVRDFKRREYPRRAGGSLACGVPGGFGGVVLPAACTAALRHSCTVRVWRK